MTYTTVTVGLAQDRSNEARLEIAGQLAERFGASVIGSTAAEFIASEVGASVVVGGAYGHSRLREWIPGGVTQRLINPSNRCSLLSR